MNETRHCPACGATLPQASTEGLCPACLMAQAMRPTGELPAPPAPDLDAVRAAFPQFDIIELIGHGGMGAVFKARQPQLDRFVALKLLAPAHTDDDWFASRFQREARALAALNHPNIVTIHDFGQAGGFFYLLMEFVDGANLRQALDAGRFTPQQALAIVPQLCDALQFAHDHGIVHRDIKPENLLLDRDGRVKIADFGIARMMCDPRPEGTPPPDAAAAPPAAAQASIVGGTPGYMAPEQAAQSGTDTRADIYSLGVVIYEMLTGELPREPITPPSRKVHIDVRLDEVVLRALAVDPELRFQRASELKTMVETIATTPPHTAPAPAPAPAAPAPRPADPAARRRGWGALALCLGGILLPVGMFAFVLAGSTPANGRLSWLVMLAGLGAAAVLELGALVFGILGWRSTPGKFAVVISALLPVLAIPAALLSFYTFRHSAARESAMQVQQEVMRQDATMRGDEEARRREAAATAAREAVATVSTCVEGDPRVATAIAKLRQHPEPEVVAELARQLDEPQPNLRRAAIYLLQNGGWSADQVRPAIPRLTTLLDHEEVPTRGMAALCLGQAKAAEALDRIVTMTRDDPSPYARRCAAYALGLLGDRRARPILQQALADPDQGVAGNAKAALAMLPTAAAPEREQLPPATAEADLRAAAERVAVEDLALRLLVAIRDRDDAALKELATDRTAGWRDALPQFALEMRERFQQMSGRPFAMMPADSLVAGDRAVVRCTGPDELQGTYLVLAFIRTPDGWRNWSLRNSPPATPLQQHFDWFSAQLDPQGAPTPSPESNQ